MKTMICIAIVMTSFSLGLIASAMAEWDIVCNFDPIKQGRVSVYTLPDGSGDPLSYAYQWDGVPGNQPSRVDATITLTLLYYGDPVYSYPREDMWLATSLGGLVLCPGGSIADSNTDQNGQTTFSLPIYGGGASDPAAGEECIVMVAGMQCPDEGVDLQFNSPDINGDLVVNLTDVVYFVQIYEADYDYAADFYWDGTINLSDIVLLAGGLGAMCP